MNKDNESGYAAKGDEARETVHEGRTVDNKNLMWVIGVLI